MNLFYITPLILQKLIWIPTRILLKVLINLEIEGLENLRGIKRNVIFASNHVSELDPILLPASLPFFSRFSPIYYASLKSDKYKNTGWRHNFYGGTFFKFWGAHPIYTGLKDYGKSLVDHEKLLIDKKNLFVFPEGRITLLGNIQPARGGVAYLRESVDCEIVPIAIIGAYGMTTSDFFFRRRKVRIIFGKPISGSELFDNVRRSVVPGENVYKEEAEYVMKKVKGLMGN